MRNQFSIAILLLLFLVMPAVAAFRTTNVTVNWQGFNDDPSGVGSFLIEGVDDLGRQVALRDVNGFGHNLITLGSTQTLFHYGGSQPFPSDEGINAFIRGVDFSRLTINGTEELVTDVSGYFRITGPVDVASGVPVVGGFDPPFASGTVEDLPVSFAFDFSINAGEHNLEGDGSGTADLSFSTWAPSNLLVLQTGAEYDLSPSNAVPEPTAIVIWIGCLAFGGLLAARRK